MLPLILSIALLTAGEIEGKVVAITDGDTITVLVNQEQVKVRLDGIDAPERSQAFGTQAREKLAELAFGKTVKVVTHGKDRYGRTIGTVFAEGRSANLEMVRAGLAWHYVEYPKDTELADAEAKARAEKRGLWADKSPVAPWEFRKRPAKKKAA
ncbi:micrococcal nuclease [bacterium]|nr:micrococcal nuclease [bacterium]